nr:MAG TPA: hypothetical protein [Caudoviricetes sp.]
MLFAIKEGGRRARLPPPRIFCQIFIACKKKEKAFAFSLDSVYF